jgi:hypothetical protein
VNKYSIGGGDGLVVMMLDHGVSIRRAKPETGRGLSNYGAHKSTFLMRNRYVLQRSLCRIFLACCGSLTLSAPAFTGGNRHHCPETTMSSSHFNNVDFHVPAGKRDIQERGRSERMQAITLMDYAVRIHQYHVPIISAEFTLFIPKVF